MTDTAEIIDVSPRDGLQNQIEVLRSTALIAQVVDRAVDQGEAPEPRLLFTEGELREIEVTRDAMSGTPPFMTRQLENAFAGPARHACPGHLRAELLNQGIERIGPYSLTDDEPLHQVWQQRNAGSQQEQGDQRKQGRRVPAMA